MSGWARAENKNLTPETAMIWWNGAGAYVSWIQYDVLIVSKQGKSPQPEGTPLNCFHAETLEQAAGNYKILSTDYLTE